MTPLVRVAEPVVQALKARVAKPAIKKSAEDCFMGLNT
jgi:hypothetical protein